MFRYQILIEYLGTSFVGWQLQKKGNSVQKVIQLTLKKLLKEKVIIYGAGRTDAGVHAKEQSAHFDIKNKIDNIEKFIKSCNFFLNPKNISIINIKKKRSNFHARFSAKKRWYKYEIINRRPPLTIDANRAWCVYKNLNIQKIKNELSSFLGKHDFNAFRSSHCQSKTSIKTIDSFDIKNENKKIIFKISAKSFLHSQVRIMVGTLVDIGKGNIDRSIETIIKLKNREYAGQTAPAQGLYLTNVEY